MMHAGLYDTAAAQTTLHLYCELELRTHNIMHSMHCVQAIQQAPRHSLLWFSLVRNASQQSAGIAFHSTADMKDS